MRGSARTSIGSPTPCSTGAREKVAGSLRGTLRAGWRIGVTLLRVATGRE
jgi:hypothetical protein